ncbi:EAL domain-containing protein [Mesorhizobium australicum]|uniref:PAS domain S-box-containing protein/diguanylate cyclase (GGDEF) domain-containing protein n=1 Tax=Mesorhizobium australicum TaxID=536018 RepID=A0A1X7NE14_9HYPH|nr:EAL domain-containing protein [Mesorhizobium australicum]SMH35936.1 PAS domain S-box-containing protein/diguanylate cyclase (GGDEF) domain-containing protein [Mesorhizobium australicum]
MDIERDTDRARYTPGRLLAVIWPFAIVVLAQTLVASLSIYTLSAVRSYVGGESMWSKGYKQAIHSLEHYVTSGDVDDFRRFESSIAIPLGDRKARLALQASPPDLDRARQGLLTGRNHPSDIPGMIWLFRYFSEMPYLAEAIEKWSLADPKIVELVEIGHDIKRERDGMVEISRAQMDAWISRVDALDREINPLTLQYAEALGRGSRAITYTLFGVNVVSALLLILLAVMRTRGLLIQRAGFEVALIAERARANVTLASIGQAVLTTDHEGRLLFLNRVGEKLLGVKPEEARQARIADLFSFDDDNARHTVNATLETLFEGGSVTSTLTPRMLIRRDGRRVPVSMVAAPLRMDGKVSGAVIVLHDMTRENEYISRLSHQATHDALTELANRRAFEARLEELIAGLAETPASHAMMFIDLDQFKIVNDTCGHAAGDELLKQVAGALGQGLAPSDMLARIGGDEFGIVLPGRSPEDAAHVAERLRAAVEDLDFRWKGRAFAVSASIGLIELSQPSTSLEEALQAADVACYLAKEKGRNRVQTHISGDAELEARIGEMAWVQRIRRATEEDGFLFLAQEIVPLAEPDTGRHIELLLRLADANGGYVSPAAFMPAAERFGLMPLIDRWVVSHAFAAIGAHLADPGAAAISTWAINLSGQTIGDTEFSVFVRDEFRRHGVPHDLVCFEITETSAISNLATARCFIDGMKALGCRFSLDDFGTGMSSFGYLKNLPVDYLKIDGSFVKNIVEDNIDRAMVETIHRIGHITGKKTIAEFVENDAILDALREIGVDYAQGYGVAAPKPLAEFRREVSGRQRRAGPLKRVV